MVVRGAPAIGVAAAYGMVLGSESIDKTAENLRKTRPTAYDLFYAIDFMLDRIKKGEDALKAADAYVEDIIDRCQRIGENGAVLIKDGMKVLTHCNAGALATVDYGTALAPFRVAHKKGIEFFVFADETRPRLPYFKLIDAPDMFSNMSKSLNFLPVFTISKMRGQALSSFET